MFFELGVGEMFLQIHTYFLSFPLELNSSKLQNTQEVIITELHEF